MQRFPIASEKTRFLQNGEVRNGFIECPLPLRMTSRFAQATRLHVRRARGRFRAGLFWPLGPMYLAKADRRPPTIHQSDWRSKVNFRFVAVYSLVSQWTLTVTPVSNSSLKATVVRRCS
jgi:hypothetical protein